MIKNKITDKLLTGGGIIPNDDMAVLQKMGVGQLFGPGTTTGEAIAYMQQWADQRSGD